MEMTAIFLHLLMVCGESPPQFRIFRQNSLAYRKKSTVDEIEKRVFFTPKDNIPYWHHRRNA
jgi:hypothetical protein